MKHLLCLLIGHRLRYQREALEGGGLYRCERCGLWLWRCPEGWYELGKD